MKATKGEWKVYVDNMAGLCDVVAEDNAGFFHAVVAHINRHDNLEYLANANLIAASKDMYEALRELLDWNRLPRGTSGRPYMADVIRLTERALAKAEGES